MVPSLVAERAVIAAQLAAALAHYEQDVEVLVQRGLDAALARDLAEQFDLMRMYATALPALSVTWVELLISRFDLSHAIWCGRGGGTSHRVVKLYAYHRNVIAEAQRKCGDYVSAAQASNEAMSPGTQVGSSRAK